MAVSKRKTKLIQQHEKPSEKSIPSEYNPLAYRGEYPAWNFAACDKLLWRFSLDIVGNTFWTEILPFLQSIESMTWQEILNYSNNKHHLIAIETLNKIARDRLYELHIEPEALMSLRLTATHRLYGYLEGAVFHLLWFDPNHGDNDTCFCRPRLKHT